MWIPNCFLKKPQNPGSKVVPGILGLWLWYDFTCLFYYIALWSFEIYVLNWTENGSSNTHRCHEEDLGIAWNTGQKERKNNHLHSYHCWKENIKKNICFNLWEKGINECITLTRCTKKSAVHGTYIRWKLKTCYARMKENRSFCPKNWIVTTLNLIESLKQVK